MTDVDSRAQQAFAAGLCRAIRETRRRQKLTQAEVAQRTQGLVSKAALANYETGHRAIRIDVLWVIAGALGTDLASLVEDAARSAPRWPNGPQRDLVTVDVAAVLASQDLRLAPVKRWFQLRQPAGTPATGSVTLDPGAIAAIAALLNTSVSDCRSLLRSVGQR